MRSAVFLYLFYQEETTITVYTSDGTEYHEIEMNYDAFLYLLRDDSIIGPNDFIELTYSGGSRAAIRKNTVVGIVSERGDVT